MSDKTIKFIFNQTSYHNGHKYQSGESIEISEKEASAWENVNFGKFYKPKVGKKKKEKNESISK